MTNKNPNVKLAQHVVAMARVLKKLGADDLNVRQDTRKDTAGFTIISFGYGGEEDFCIDASTGIVIHDTWETSPHNGDSYGHNEKMLSPVDAHKELSRLTEMLRRRGIVAEEKQAKFKEDERRTRELLCRFEQRVAKEM